MHISITPDDVLKARGSNFLDDMDTYSSAKGELGVVAMKDGCHICWACGDLFDLEEGSLRPYDKYTGGPGSPPVMVHRKCALATRQQYSMPSVAEVSRGLGLRRTIAKVMKPFLPK
jgi:hypothetical protein